jgi:hypothetical protein
MRRNAGTAGEATPHSGVECVDINGAFNKVGRRREAQDWLPACDSSPPTTGSHAASGGSVEQRAPLGQRWPVHRGPALPTPPRRMPAKVIAVREPHQFPARAVPVPVRTTIRWPGDPCPISRAHQIPDGGHGFSVGRCADESDKWVPRPVQGAYHLKMNTTRIQRLVAGGALAAAAVLGAPTALAQPADPGSPANPGNPANPDNLNSNDARCLAEPFMLQCQGSRYGGVPGAFSGAPGMGGIP